jgi:hypothetical protein
MQTFAIEDESTPMQRPGALIMPVLRKLHLVHRDAEVLQDAMLKFVFEYLSVAVNDELASDEVEHDASPRPFLVFGFKHDGGESVRWASYSPTFPEFVVAVRAGEEVAIFLSSRQCATVCHEENFSGIVPYEPVRADKAFSWMIPRSRRAHGSHYRLKRPHVYLLELVAGPFPQPTSAANPNRPSNREGEV